MSCFFSEEKPHIGGIIIIAIYDILWVLLYLFYVRKKGEGSVGTTYSLELTGKEMLYFFFKRKKCPICSEIMKRQKNVESLGEGIQSVGLGKYYYGQNNKVTLFYKCEKCNKLYSISDL